ncbi:hypothetical protein ACWDRM_09585 [Streptomyces cellulosae]
MLDKGVVIAGSLMR